MSGQQVWQPGMYDDKMGFVSAYGKGVVELLNPRKGERILDLGCGTGDLTQQIADAGADVTGMDLSVPMIAKARQKYPGLDFQVGDAGGFRLPEPVDAVFSNAALHWMKDALAVADSVWQALKPGGRFVAELGGKGNVQAIVQCLSEVLRSDYGLDADALNPWYFPSLGEYSAVLEGAGFRVTFAAHFDRPTRLGDSREGLFHWLDGFAAGPFFSGFEDAEKRIIYHKIADLAEERLYRDGSWHADYVRLRVAAVKPPGIIS